MQPIYWTVLSQPIQPRLLISLTARIRLLESAFGSWSPGRTIGHRFITDCFRSLHGISPRVEALLSNQGIRRNTPPGVRCCTYTAAFDIEDLRRERADGTLDRKRAAATI